MIGKLLRGSWIAYLLIPIAVGAVLFPVVVLVEWGWWGLFITVPYVLVLGVGLYAAAKDRPWRRRYRAWLE